MEARRIVEFARASYPRGPLENVIMEAVMSTLCLREGFFDWWQFYSLKGEAKSQLVEVIGLCLEEEDDD
jgi:hypothetical protein